MFIPWILTGNVKQKHHMIYKHVSCEFKQHERLQKKAEKDHMTQTHSDSNFPVVCYFVQSTG